MRSNKKVVKFIENLSLQDTREIIKLLEKTNSNSQSSFVVEEMIRKTKEHIHDQRRLE